MGEADESYVISVPRPFRLSASGRNKIHPSIHLERRIRGPPRRGTAERDRRATGSRSARASRLQRQGGRGTRQRTTRWSFSRRGRDCLGPRSPSYKQVSRRRGAGSLTHRGPCFPDVEPHPRVPAGTAQSP
ncbi:hypothetical protein N658DRAFT_260594 [Parathielavia hyrcaniae]|uniref:Uncharacterized protein n=1 Tax=Parathielavia hyrcaniae TaxID=113614 RepID=A0AAN6PX89_9PEZI|nr:hypothetical protein N658DRAFT_260594 [Parathielavia hyrcaniae]